MLIKRMEAKDPHLKPRLQYGPWANPPCDLVRACSCRRERWHRRQSESWSTEILGFVASYWSDFCLFLFGSRSWVWKAMINSRTTMINTAHRWISRAGRRYHRPVQLHSTTTGGEKAGRALSYHLHSFGVLLLRNLKILKLKTSLQNPLPFFTDEQETPPEKLPPVASSINWSKLRFNCQPYHLTGGCGLELFADGFLAIGKWSAFPPYLFVAFWKKRVRNMILLHMEPEMA